MKAIELTKLLYDTEKDLNELRSKIFQIKDEMYKIEVAVESQIQKQYINQRTNKEFRESQKYLMLSENEKYQELRQEHNSLLKQIDDLETYKRYLERIYNLLINNVVSAEVLENAKL